MKITEQTIQKNIILAPYSSFNIGGKADYFSIVKTKNDLLYSIAFAKKNKIPFYIIGQGTNILISDKGFRGLIIKMEINEYNITKTNSKIIKIKAGTGILMSRLLLDTVKNNISGLEWTAGLPGTLGGAIYGNASCFGKSTNDIIDSIEILNLKNNKIENIKKDKCQFNYKNSIFKKNKKLIIISAILKLKKKQSTISQQVIKENILIRHNNHPKGKSAGCVFKNIPISQCKNLKIINVLKSADLKNKKLIPAGLLIEKCGLKGKRIGDAIISQQHSNFIINLNKASFKDVNSLIKLTKNKIKQRFGILLKEEIQYII